MSDTEEPKKKKARLEKTEEKDQVRSLLLGRLGNLRCSAEFKGSRARECDGGAN